MSSSSLFWMTLLVPVVLVVGLIGIRVIVYIEDRMGCTLEDWWRSRK